MKKVILAAIAVSSFAFTNAQTTMTNANNSTAISNSTRFGLKVGINVSNLSGTGVTTNADPRLGFQGGGLVEFRLSDVFSIQPEVLISLQGSRFDSPDYDILGTKYSQHNKVNLGYINVPIMFKFYPIQKLSLEAGPQLGILIAAKQDSEIRANTGGNVVTTTQNIDAKNQYNSADFGANAGVSYYFTDNVFVSARYTFGLTSISEKAYVGSGTLGNPVNSAVIHNNVAALSFGYRF